MNELRVILRCPVTFTARMIATLCFAAYPLFELHKEKNLSELSSMTLLLIMLSVIGQVGNQVSAWFSTTAGKAKGEIASESNGKSEQAKAP